jgi:hypothetical protein
VFVKGYVNDSRRIERRAARAGPVSYVNATYNARCLGHSCVMNVCGICLVDLWVQRVGLGGLAYARDHL